MTPVVPRPALPRRLLTGLLAILVATTCTAATVIDDTASALAARPAELSADREQVRAAVNVVRQLQSHYRQMPFDAALADRLFTAYIAALDEQRIYFYAADIEELERQRAQVERALRTGDLAPAFVVFNRYQQRVVERLQFLVATLDKGVGQFDFGKDEVLEVERKDAAWPATRAEMNDLWRRRLKAAVLDLRLSGKPDAEIQVLLAKRYRSQINRTLQVRPEDAVAAWLNALAGLFDPHTEYLSPQTSENFNINMSLQLEGIGAVLQTEDDYTKVLKLVPGSPADKSGLVKPGDRIIGVGQARGEIVDVVGWRLDEVVELIRGAKGTQVRLQVIPATAKDSADTRIVTLTRAAVQLEEQAAHREVIEVPANGRTARIGVITLPAFYIDFDAAHRGDPDYRSTTRDVARLLGELRRENVEGVILDLRDNGGGSLEEVKSLVGLFISTGPVVQVRWANSKVEPDGDYDPSVLYGGPLAVMVNRLSASASEIFAAAIQDYGRGIVIGDQTFGKGTVQTLRPLNQGQLKITTAKFYRISGESTQLKGVMPDIAFPTLFNREDIGESALPNALPWDTIRPARYVRSGDFAPLLPELRRRSEARTAANPDFQYLRAQLALLEEARKRKTLSLNEAERRRERDQLRQRSLDIENKRRKALGEPLLKSVEELEKLNEQQEQAADDTAQSPQEKAALMEAGRILADHAALSRPATTAQARRPLPATAPARSTR